MKKTPLADTHVSLGARMVDFAGWYMPVQYSGLREEHDNVRNNVGLFDVSHMGEVRVKGPKALETLEWLTTNDVARLNDGELNTLCCRMNKAAWLMTSLFIAFLKTLTIWCA